MWIFFEIYFYKQKNKTIQDEWTGGCINMGTVFTNQQLKAIETRNAIFGVDASVETEENEM